MCASGGGKLQIINTNDVLKALVALKNLKTKISKIPVAKESTNDIKVAHAINSSIAQNAKIIFDNMNPQDKSLFHAHVFTQLDPETGMNNKITTLKINGEEIFHITLQAANRKAQIDNLPGTLAHWHIGTLFQGVR